MLQGISSMVGQAPSVPYATARAPWKWQANVVRFCQEARATKSLGLRLRCYGIATALHVCNMPEHRLFYLLSPPPILYRYS